MMQTDASRPCGIIYRQRVFDSVADAVSFRKISVGSILNAAQNAILSCDTFCPMHGSQLQRHTKIKDLGRLQTMGFVNGSLLKISRIFSFFRSGGQAISTYSTLLSFETTLCEIENDGKVHYRRCTSVHWHTFVKCYQPLLRSILKQSWWQHI